MALILISSTPAYCQDLLAKQAPVASKSQTLTLYIDSKGVVSIQKYQGSDYIPKTAPVDKGMRQVDSIVLNKKADQDEASFPSPDHSSNNAHFHKSKEWRNPTRYCTQM